MLRILSKLIYIYFRSLKIAILTFYMVIKPINYLYISLALIQASP